MSITLGSPTAPPPGTCTILIGGTGSAPRDAAASLFDHARAAWGERVWPGHDLPAAALIAEWAGGFPVKVLWFPVFDPRRKGIRNVLDIAVQARQAKCRHIALVGFSHGGTIAIKAMDEMLRIPIFRDCELRLVTLATPPLRDTQAAAIRVGTAVQPVTDQAYRVRRVDWLGVVDRDDSVVTGFAGLIEPLHDQSQVQFGVESSFRQLATNRGGIAAHDGLPGSTECREAIRAWFGRHAEEG